MEIVSDTSAASFLQQAGALLYSNEPANSLMLGLCENINPSSKPLLIRMMEHSRTVSAAVQTPPKNLVLTYSTDDQLRALANYLNDHQMTFPGVVGPARDAETFAAIWAGLTNCRIALGMGQKIYKLEQAIFPRNVPGKLRLAEPFDTDLITQWIAEFEHEAIPPAEQRSIEQCRQAAVRAIHSRLAHMWELDRASVSMAFASRPTKNGISITAVYTPKVHRKRGYASATVAHLSQLMLDAGKKFCVLYTDLSNPTSNKIYQDIGYCEFAASKLLLFES